MTIAQAREHASNGLNKAIDYSRDLKDSILDRVRSNGNGNSKPAAKEGFTGFDDVDEPKAMSAEKSLNHQIWSAVWIAVALLASLCSLALSVWWIALIFKAFGVGTVMMFIAASLALTFFTIGALYKSHWHSQVLSNQAA